MKLLFTPLSVAAGLLAEGLNWQAFCGFGWACFGSARFGWVGSDSPSSGLGWGHGWVAAVSPPPFLPGPGRPRSEGRRRPNRPCPRRIANVGVAEPAEFCRGDRGGPPRPPRRRPVSAPAHRAGDARAPHRARTPGARRPLGVRGAYEQGRANAPWGGEGIEPSKREACGRTKAPSPARRGCRADQSPDAARSAETWTPVAW